MANRRRQEPLASGKDGIAATQACMCLHGETDKGTPANGETGKEQLSGESRHLFCAGFCRVTFIVT